MLGIMARPPSVEWMSAFMILNSSTEEPRRDLRTLCLLSLLLQLTFESFFFFFLFLALSNILESTTGEVEMTTRSRKSKIIGLKHDRDV